MLSGYAATHPNGDPVSDRILALASDTADGSVVEADPSHTGTLAKIVTLQHVVPSAIQVGSDLLWH